ncbi:MAG: ammonium transporter [Bacteroidales bacterium OttesenSCG-928-I14]|jgi:Amt family ammonium transporter|nr:ammonium transporter [Bacteroidales bacterium OttesenSCG-928-I14]
MTKIMKEYYLNSRLDTGNTAWMLVATLLVMLMTIPGLALFYGGLVRQKNVLSVIIQCFILTSVISILWISFGYSWVFGTAFAKQNNPLALIIGGFEKVFLKNVKLNTLTDTNIPETVFSLFQCMFAVITPSLIIGAFAERIKFSGFLVFTIIWSIFVYNPMAHWVWGGGWIGEKGIGAIDFAGGTVVHINAGITALIMAIMIGKRKNYTHGTTTPPHNVPFVFLGTALLWIGWIGFNAGSSLAANGIAANAFLTTHFAASVAVVTWITIDWIREKKPTIIGACTGAIAGLVAITPAAGSVDILGSFFIGIISSFVCFFMVAFVKSKLKYDDTLDAFGVHGVGGIIGSILTGVFATKMASNSNGVEGALYGNWHQLFVQIVATLFSILYSAIMTIIIFRIVDKIIGIRVSLRIEEEGLDIYEHGETAYN